VAVSEAEHLGPKSGLTLGLQVFLSLQERELVNNMAQACNLWVRKGDDLTTFIVPNVETIQEA
jgi:hypothetical protein